MKPRVTYLSLSLFFLSYAIFALILSFSHSQHASAAIIGSEIDKLVLLEFKSRVTEDPTGVLGSWNDSFHFCNWTGVACGLKQERVIVLDIVGRKLGGTIPPHKGNLSFLRILNLGGNFFSSGIPPELGHLRRLQTLDLSSNSLGGYIPVNLSRCSNLINLTLDHNYLKGEIPSQLGSLSNLLNLFLANNNLTGKFPSSLGNLSSLQQLDLAFNSLEGDILDVVAQMRSLTSFEVSVNKFSGSFPDSLYNLSSLTAIGIGQNNISGSLSTDIGLAFPNLQTLVLGVNRFHGHICSSLSNASSLVTLDFSQNNFIGTIPLSFGVLQSLQDLNIALNFLGTRGVDDLSFLTSLANCSDLKYLEIGNNQFGGQLISSIANMPKGLGWFRMSGNFIHGSIPPEVANLTDLYHIGMGNNKLIGTIPASLGKLPRLQALFLDSNLLTGEIPSSFGNASLLSIFYLSNNSLEGCIPSSLGSCKYLQYLFLNNNELNGTIPTQLSGLSSLCQVDFSSNCLIGSLPMEVGNSSFLTQLNVSYNKMSGEIPRELGSCLALEQLYMQGNLFQGIIPYMGNLRDLQILDLSNNSLDGQIPLYLVNISSLLNLNLSYNNLEGEVPVVGVFTNVSAIELFGNKNLCGGIPELRFHPCPKKQRKHTALKLILAVTVFLSFIAISLLLLLTIWRRNLREKTRPIPSLGLFHPKISYKELRNATGGFSSSNVIGSGSFGIVYKGILGPDESIVAIKILNLQQRGSSKSFMAECQALRNIRHRNLVKVLTACSSIDFEGNDFKALVYPIMPNGSLEKWLHPEVGRTQTRYLNFLQRLNIAIDVASALLYVHHECQIPIVHCDLKPSNVLLDDDMIAHLSDFGLARILTTFNKDANFNQFSSLGMKGTIGYAAPEYGLGGKVSVQGDAYSYGILLLEMFTGRRPTHDQFKDDCNLHNFVALALPDQAMGIVDPSALPNQVVGEPETSSSFWSGLRSEHVNCLVSVFQIGVACSAEFPHDRMDMKQVLKELLSARDNFLGNRQLNQIDSPVIISEL